MIRATRIAALVLLLCIVAGAESPPIVRINLPESVASEAVEIHYFMIGEFGGFGSQVPQAKNRKYYTISAEVHGKAASEIRLITFAPGCALKTFQFNLAETQEPQAEFVCEALPKVKVEGRVVPLRILQRHQAMMRIDYLANWGHAFFGIMDGMVPQFALVEAPVDADGNFSAEIPDFSMDTETQKVGRGSAELMLTLVDKNTLNPLADRLSFSEFGLAWGSLQIRPWYPKLTVTALREGVPLAK